MTAIEKAKQGLCELCDSPVHHGPYTDKEIAEIQADIGLEPDELSDLCDDCFLSEIAQGDEARASHYLGGRALQLRKAQA
ncbi:hypothetical protein [Acidovorax sp. BL-A-41-H1]|uniref:hypothetical protein n=1 Tax=Acidovorax sp. BL-A-41-H1 TaxID=3421102 RepID=UPI003F792684